MEQEQLTLHDIADLCDKKEDAWLTGGDIEV